jgi:hypothetical protein
MNLDILFFPSSKSFVANLKGTYMLANKYIKRSKMEVQNIWPEPEPEPFPEPFLAFSTTPNFHQLLVMFQYRAPDATKLSTHWVCAHMYFAGMIAFNALHWISTAE